MIKLIFLAAFAWATTGISHRYEVKVDGMVCNLCVQSLKMRLEKNKEIKEAKIDFDNKLIVITTKPDQDISIDKIKESITDTGYVPQEVKRVE